MTIETMVPLSSGAMYARSLLIVLGSIHREGERLQVCSLGVCTTNVQSRRYGDSGEANKQWDIQQPIQMKTEAQGSFFVLRIVGAVIDEVKGGTEGGFMAMTITSSIVGLLRSRRRRVCKSGRGCITASIRVESERADNLHIGSGGGRANSKQKYTNSSFNYYESIAAVQAERICKLRVARLILIGSQEEQG